MSRPRDIVLQILLILCLVVLCTANAYLLVRAVGILRLPDRVSEYDIIRQGAYTMITYYENLAAEAQLDKSVPVRDILASFKFEVDRAITPEEIVNALNYYGRSTKAILEREEEDRLREALLQLLGKEPGIQSVTDRASIVVSKEEGQSLSITDPLGLLSQSTKEAITHMFEDRVFSSVIEIEVTEGKPALLRIRTLIDRLKLLQNEVESTRATLREIQRISGFGQISGSGILIEMYAIDHMSAMGQRVSAQDVRNVVNELYSAGAVAVDIGGERLIATSSIKEIDSRLLVNGNEVSRDPIAVRAVGDSEILSSYLVVLKNSLEMWGIQMDIYRVDVITLSPYKGSGV